MNTPPPTLPELPQLSDDRLNAVEAQVFTRIAEERRRRSARRGRLWMTGGAAAVVIVLAAAIAPGLSGMGGSAGGGADSSAVEPAIGTDRGFAIEDSTVESLPEDSLPDVTGEQGDSTGGEIAGDADSDRDVIATASATVRVDDPGAAVASITDAAAARGGYVESATVGLSDVGGDFRSDGIVDPGPPIPGEGAWITVRVPADQLTAMTADLTELGEVTSSNIARQDVTEQTVDLRARIDAARTSVDRLMELMTRAASVTDLIAAETALSERQATLESYEQQLQYLESQVAMSSLTVTLVPRIDSVVADPAGFGDGLAAGWNGLVATLNGIVVGLGFLVPWLALIAVAAAGIFGITVLVRRIRRRGREEHPAE